MAMENILFLNTISVLDCFHTNAININGKEDKLEGEN